MNRPDFSAVARHSAHRDSHLRAGVPQAVPYGTRIYKCECCNDTGIVQTWKLNKWALGPNDPPLDSCLSLPIFCTRLASCGNRTQQVFAGSRDDDETAERTAEANLFKGNSESKSAIGSLIASGQLRALSAEQAQYIHDKVLEYREFLWTQKAGQDYLDAVKEACRNATPHEDVTKTRVGNGRLMHIGEILRVPDLPEEPDCTVPPSAARVQPTDPRDFAPATPAQPVDLEVDW
jgi:hypothetical protein